MASQITATSTVCLIVSAGWQQRKLRIYVVIGYPHMGLLADTQNCGLRIRREWRERLPRHRFQRKPLVNDPGMHHGTCVTHVRWCMSGSLIRRWREKCSRHSRRMRNPQFCVSGNRAHRANSAEVSWRQYVFSPWTFLPAQCEDHLALTWLHIQYPYWSKYIIHLFTDTHAYFQTAIASAQQPPQNTWGPWITVHQAISVSTGISFLTFTATATFQMAFLKRKIIVEIHMDLPILGVSRNPGLSRCTRAMCHIVVRRASVS